MGSINILIIFLRGKWTLHLPVILYSYDISEQNDMFGVKQLTDVTVHVIFCMRE